MQVVSFDFCLRKNLNRKTDILKDGFLMRLKQHLIYLLNVELILQPSLSDPLRLRKLNERGEEGRE